MRLAIVGLGKIVRDQHLAAIAGNPDIALAATVDPVADALPGVPHFSSLAEMLASDCQVDAVALCTTPQVRFPLALEAIERGLHVFCEKPPVTGLSEAQTLAGAAAEAGVTLFAAWHSRMAAGVEQARAWLAGTTIERIEITWREDVRRWHPGQAWIARPGGMGVFDPGINALSILTVLLKEPVTLASADFEVPANWQTPIAVRLAMRSESGVPIDADFDFRQEGPQTWRIAVATDHGTLSLDDGGARLTLPANGSAASIDGLGNEYPALYAHFTELVERGESDFDVTPLALVADAFLIAEHTAVAPFRH